MNIKTVLLPDGDDPDSFAHKHNASDFIEYINQNQVDFIDFKIKNIQNEAKNDPIKKAALIGDLLHFISLISDKIIRSLYVKECASKLEMDENIIYNEINKILRKRKEEEIKRFENERLIEQNQIPQDISENKDLSTQPIDFKINKKNSLDKYEKELIQYIIRYGQKPLVADDNARGFLYVGEYICQVLKDNELQIHNKIFAQILDEFYQNIDQESFNCENYFKYHQNSEINKFAVDMLADKYTLSKRYDNQDKEEEIPIPEVDETDEQSIRNYYFAITRKEMEEKKQLRRQQEDLEIFKNMLDKVILVYVYAIFNSKLEEKRKAVEQKKDEIDEYKKVVEQRYGLIENNLKNRVIVKIR